MNSEDTYVEADSTNLPKVDALMLFDFMKDGRKFSYTEFENDKENLVMNKYGDDSIGYVLVLRNPVYCVVKANITTDKESAIAVRALIHETKNAIFKLECKQCWPADCIHGFSLLLWLHRRTEESRDQVVNYYRKPGSIFDKMSKDDMTDNLLTPKSSNSPLQTNNYLNNHCSPETKQFLHGCGIYSQTSVQTSQNSQTVLRLSQPTSEKLSQNSSSNSECSQKNNLEMITQEDCKMDNSVIVPPLSQKNDEYSTQLSQTVVHTTQQHTPRKASQQSNSHRHFSQIRNLEMATGEDYKSKNSAFTEPLTQVDPYPQLSQTLHTPVKASQKTDAYSTQPSQTLHQATQHTPVKVSQRTDAYSTQPSQTLHQATQHTPVKVSQRTDAYYTQLSQTVYRKTQHPPIKGSQMTDVYPIRLSQRVYQTTPAKASQKSNSNSHLLAMRNLGMVSATGQQSENSTLNQPLTQIDNYSTQLSQRVHATQNTLTGDSLMKSRYDHTYTQVSSSKASREHCEAETLVLTQPPTQSAMPLSQMTNNTENTSSPKQSRSAKKSPYSQNKSAKAISPKTLKKQSMLSKKVSQLVKQPKIDNFFMKPKPELKENKPQIKNLFMNQLVKDFLKLNKGTVEDFMSFAGKQMTEFLCQEAEKQTRMQSKTDLWMDLRYGRITASIIHEAANCRTINGSLVNKILGKVSGYQSSAMKRGLNLEDKILHQVKLQENLTTSTSGLFLVPWCPIIGASPDAIGSDFIVEIKAPSSDTSFNNFLPNGNISKKCKSQMFLQMYCTGMKKGIFCVADPNFERNKKVTTVWLDYDDEEFNGVLEKAKMFWISAIFPRLVNL